MNFGIAKGYDVKLTSHSDLAQISSGEMYVLVKEKEYAKRTFTSLPAYPKRHERK